MPKRPIGIFDSGVGGLTVVSEIFKQLPNENIVYFGDVGRTPYGPRSKEIILQFTRQDVAFLREQNVKFIIAACNTASAVALETVSSELEIDMLGVIEPGARSAVTTTKNGKIGIIGTHATIASNSYPRAIHNIDDKIKLFSLACPLFVPLAEEAYQEKPASSLIAEDYLRSIRENGIDTLVMGCTHYPLLRQLIQETIGDDVTLIDSAVATAKELKEHLLQSDLLIDANSKPEHKFYVSDMPDKFASVAERFLGRKVDNTIRVDITKY